MTELDVDLAVVGAGIVGAACAHAAAEEGLRVAVVEAVAPAAGTTSAGMGHIVVLDGSPAELALTRYSQRLWAELGPRLPPGVSFRSEGTLWIARSEEDLRTAESKAERLHGARIPAELLDGEELAMMEPLLRDGLAGALLVPEDLLLDPIAATQALLEQVRERGGQVVAGAVVRRTAPGRLEGDHGLVVRARGIVNAAGVRAPELTPGLPIAPRKGHLVLLARGRGRIRHQVVEIGYGAGVRSAEPVSVAMNLHPRADGSVLVGASREWAGFDGSVDPRVVDRLLAKVREFAPPLSEWPRAGTRAGFRPATPDHLPWIGRMPDAPDLLVAAGHEGLGVTESLGTARLVLDAFLDRASPIPPEPYRPDAGRLAQSFSVPREASTAH